jgi:hypothetical protein
MNREWARTLGLRNSSPKFNKDNYPQMEGRPGDIIKRADRNYLVDKNGCWRRMR